jgi:hypothetical protein
MTRAAKITGIVVTALAATASGIAGALGLLGDVMGCSGWFQNAKGCEDARHLLVAAVALGAVSTAGFAWFVSRKTMRLEDETS